MAERAIGHGLMSVAEYLEFEKNSPVKHEYVGGRAYAMTGVSRRHSRIALNIARKLADSTGGGPCRVHQSDMRVSTPDGPYYYPDVVVACEEEPEDEYVEDAPCLLVEVLSQSTGATDRREKLIAYRRIESLRAYLIVSQDDREVERHYRDSRGDWQTEIHTSGPVPLSCPPDALLTLESIYEGL